MGSSTLQPRRRGCVGPPVLVDDEAAADQRNAVRFARIIAVAVSQAVKLSAHCYCGTAGACASGNAGRFSVRKRTRWRPSR